MRDNRLRVQDRTSNIHEAHVRAICGARERYKRPNDGEESVERGNPMKMCANMSTLRPASAPSP